MKGKIPVTVATLDGYCVTNLLDRIDVLKMEVLNGGIAMLDQGRVGAVLMEITFSEIYKHLPGLDEIYKFMIERGFFLVAFYDFHYRHDRLGWCDAMFARRR